MTAEDLKYYGPLASALTETQDLVLKEIARVLKNITSDAEHSPAEHVISRIKSSESLNEKLRKKGLEQSPEIGIENLSDIIGVRVVAHFVGDVYSILEALKESPLWEICEVKDYIASPKPNGYRSLHVIIQLPESRELPNGIRAEIQLRTVAMDCWASLEHQLKYKKDIQNTKLIVAELKRCADEMASCDLSMQTIREMISGS